MSSTLIELIKEMTDKELKDYIENKASEFSEETMNLIKEELQIRIKSTKSQLHDNLAPKKQDPEFSQFKPVEAIPKSIESTNNKPITKEKKPIVPQAKPFTEPKEVAYQTSSLQVAHKSCSTNPDLEYYLANKSSRLFSAIIDIGIFLCILGASIISFLLGVYESVANTIVFSCLLSMSIVYFSMQIVLLSTRGQTFGKMFLSISIVKRTTGKRSGFFTNFLLRIVLSNFFNVLIIYPLADILFIFSKDQRCLHDIVADTVVIDLKAPVANTLTKSESKSYVAKFAFILSFMLIFMCLSAYFINLTFEYENSIKTLESIFIKKQQEDITFKSFDGTFILKAPKGWSVGEKSDNSEAAMILFNKTQSNAFIVFSIKRDESSKNMTLDEVMKVLQESHQYDDAKFINNSAEIQLREFNALEFEYTKDIDPELQFLEFLVETNDNYYRLVAYCNKTDFVTSKEQFEAIAKSFDLVK